MNSKILFYVLLSGLLFLYTSVLSRDIPEDERAGTYIEQTAKFTLESVVGEGEAAIWYLFHAGWAVKTKSSLMIFDYWERMTEPENPSLNNGFVDPEEIKDLDVYVFISHGHGDHFDKKILEWSDKIVNIKYIFGWKAFDDPDFEYFGETRETRKIGNLEVSNVFHNFDQIPESAFLIKVDGLTIHFSGDHGNGPEKLNPVFKDNIDYLVKMANETDIMFFSIFGQPDYPGEIYALQAFKPTVMFPMHYGGRENLVHNFLKAAKGKTEETKMHYSQKMGDSFFYKNGKIRQ